MSDLLDGEGYLADPSMWNEEIAQEIAKRQFGIELTEAHWTCIRVVRKYYEKWSSLPMVKTIREEAGVDAQEFESLFRRGNSSARGVLCKISGLPRLLCISAGC
jgi:tRNA 2-thiouridine synthesizing protein E